LLSKKNENKNLGQNEKYIFFQKSDFLSVKTPFFLIEAGEVEFAVFFVLTFSCSPENLTLSDEKLDLRKLKKKIRV
jgi:hypothetical protein